MPIPLNDPQLVLIASGAAFFFGLAFGSFLNVVIYRIPNQRSVVHPDSACPHCGHAIRFYDNYGAKRMHTWLPYRIQLKK